MSAVKIQDLNPIEATIKLNDTEYTLRKFDLLARSWAHTEFSTNENQDALGALADNMKNILESNDYTPLLKVCWHLLKRKRDFKTYELFVSAVEKGDDENSTVMKLGELLMAFNKTLGLSELSMDEIKEDIELKKH